MRPKALSRQLRTANNRYLNNRRRVAELSLISLAAMSGIALYQLGIIDHLPEPDLPWLDADSVDASAEAYAKFMVPDAFLGLVSYAGTMALAAMGSAKRETEQPWISLAFAAKVGFDNLQALRLFIDQWSKHKAFCSWCLVSAGATFATAPQALPELRAALQQLRSR